MYILKWQKEKRDRFCVGSEKGSVLTCWSAPDDSPALRQQQSSVFSSIFHSLSPFYCYYGLFGCCSIRPYTTSWLEWVNEILTNFVFSLASIALRDCVLELLYQKRRNVQRITFLSNRKHVLTYCMVVIQFFPVLPNQMLKIKLWKCMYIM